MDGWTRGLRSDPVTPRPKPPASASLAASEVIPPNSARGTPRMRHAAAEELLPPNSARGTPRFRHGAAAVQQSSLKGAPPKSACKPPRLNFSRLHGSDGEAGDHGGDDTGDTGSVVSASETQATDEYDLFDGDSVQVLVRVRPMSGDELDRNADVSSCVSISGTRRVTLRSAASNGQFEFDAVLGDSSTQEDVFEIVGLPMVEHCISGYNSSIFAYGQTGAGKTFTMQGEISKSNEERSELRGLTPRVFDYLFEKIAQEEDNKEHEKIHYNCKISFLEIYNESITDLLEPKSVDLQLREDRSGCFVEGLSEHCVLNSDDVLSLMRRGSANRHVRETRLNSSSSRSHSVFTCTVERSSEPTSGGVTRVMRSRLNLIDLAGSERVKAGAVGGVQAQGEHFKESVSINKSLTTLGRVITQLSSHVRGSKKGTVPKHHVPYRDSKLTFLLQDSLGGNAKTSIVANVSPACPEETASTLKFVQHAKCIRNRAQINLDIRGNVAMLQKEIQKLTGDLEALRKGFTDPAIQEASMLREKLIEHEKEHSDLQLKINLLVTEGTRHKRERQRLEDKLTSSQSHGGIMEERVQRLLIKIDIAEAASEAAKSAWLNAHTLELKVVATEASLVAEALKKQHQQLQTDLTSQVEAAQKALEEQLSESASRIAGLQEHLREEAASRQEAEQKVDSLSASLTESQEEAAQQVQMLQQQLEEAEVKRQERDDVVTGLSVTLSARQLEATEQLEKVSRLEADLDQRGDELEGSKQAGKVLEEDLARERMCAESLQKELQDVSEAHRAARSAHEADVAAAALVQSELQVLLSKYAEAELQLQETAQNLESTTHALEHERTTHAAAQSVLVSTSTHAAHLESELEAARQQAVVHTNELASLGQQLEEQRVAWLAESAALKQQVESSIECLAVERSTAANARNAHGQQVEVLQGQVEALQGQVDARQEQVEALQGQVSALELKCTAVEAAADKLRAAVREEETARSDAEVSCSSYEACIAALQIGKAEAEAAALLASNQQAARLAELQKEMIRSQEAAVALQYEGNMRESRLTCSVDAAHKCQTELQEKVAAQEKEVAYLREALDAQRAESSSLRSVVGERSNEVAQLKHDMESERTMMEQQLKSSSQTVNALQAELDQIGSSKGELEHQVKGFLVTSTRQNQAFHEIKRLINWATSPASSRRSSMAGSPTPESALKAIADASSLDKAFSSCAFPGPNDSPTHGPPKHSQQRSSHSLGSSRSSSMSGTVLATAAARADSSSKHARTSMQLRTSVQQVPASVRATSVSPAAAPASPIKSPHQRKCGALGRASPHMKVAAVANSPRSSFAVASRLSLQMVVSEDVDAALLTPFGSDDLEDGDQSMRDQTPTDYMTPPVSRMRT